MDGLEIFAILIISIIVIMIFQGSLGEVSYSVAGRGHRVSLHPYHPHRRHPHHKHHRHHHNRHHRVYEGYANENLYKNTSDVEQANYGVYNQSDLHSNLASDIISEF